MKDEEIETNCAKALLIISSNKTLREIVAENSDAKAIISMALDKGAPGVDSEIDDELLAEIEQESFKMGAQKTQKRVGGRSAGPASARRRKLGVGGVLNTQYIEIPVGRKRSFQ